MSNEVLKEEIKKGLNDKKTIMYILSALLIAVIILTVQFKALFYEKQHPLICTREAKITEILSINGRVVKLKLSNEEVVNYQIKRHREEDGEHYFPKLTIPKLEPGQMLCLNYDRK
jgi:hypothetical protein